MTKDGITWTFSRSAPNGKSGFDSRVGSYRFDASLRRYLPITLNPGDSIVSSISIRRFS
jgi:hypothetical protein